MIKVDEKDIKFVASLYEKSRADSTIRAALHQLKSPTTEKRAWPLLVQYGVDFKKPSKEAYSLVASAIGESKAEKDGTESFGKVLYMAFKDVSAGGEARMMRILACDSIPEICKVLRPLFGLFNSRCPGKLCLSELLSYLVRFNMDWARLEAKERWAYEFYSNVYKKDGEGEKE